MITLLKEMMIKKFFFLVGFSDKIGTGHLYRALNLASFLKKKGNKVILIEKKRITLGLSRQNV